MKTIIERGASWTLEETKLLLALWGQDLVQRQTTNQKRTKEVYEKISEKFNLSGYERTADQVRTRVFNMIAEYRRIVKDPQPERIKKCIFYEALDKIYQAKHMDDVKSALDDYEPEYPYSPASNTISSEKGEESISDSEATRGNDTTLNTTVTNNNNGNNNDASAATAINSNNSELATSDNNGDSINDTNGADSHPSAKRVKLESPKSGSSHATNSSEQANTNSKQGKSSSNQGGLSNASASTASATTSNGSSAPAGTTTSTSSSSTSSSAPKNQSLLLSHGTSTSSASSTPINKLSSSSNSSYININSTKLPIIRTNQLIGNPNGTESVGGTSARLPTTAAITSHQLYQAPVNTFDVTSSALLIDRMFAHLTRESDTIRERIALEKDRLAYEKLRRAQDAERELRRERVLVDTLLRFQEQWISYLSRLNPGAMANLNESPPELNIPPNETQLSTSGTSNSEVPVKSTPPVTTTSNTSMTSSMNTTTSTGTSAASVNISSSSTSDQSQQS